MTSPDRGRTLRRAVVGALILFSFPILLFAGPQVWFWISTTPEPDFTTVAASGLFCFPEVEGRVRILRWGADAGARHGPFRGERDGLVLTGQYDRGWQVGKWILTEGDAGKDTVKWEAFGLDLERDAFESVVLCDIEVEIEISANQGWRWRVPQFGEWLEGGEAMLAVQRGPDGTRGVGPFEVYDFTTWGMELPRLELRADRSVSRLVSPDGLLTDYDEHGAIVSQAVTDDGDELDRRSSPPWWDPISGEEENIFAAPVRREE